MNRRLRSLLFWILAFLLTLAAAVYQRRTGPSYPMKGQVMIGSTPLRYSLIRTYDGADDAPVKVLIADSSVSGELKLKRYKSNDEWSSFTMVRQGDQLTGFIPHQPKAGKVIYYVILFRDGKSYPLNDKPAIIRFRGFVPPGILHTHIFLIFIAMILSTRTGLEVIFRGRYTYLYTWLTVVTFLAGGMILGPVVQKYSFDAYRTGWPFGHDLTDNKSLVAFIFWLVALGYQMVNRKRTSWALVASIILFAIYLIPHSVLGSEIDHTKEAVKTGNTR